MQSAIFNSRTGVFTILGAVDDGGTERVLHEAKGYAGNGSCKNNPDCEHRKGRGPLPRGRYRVQRMGPHPRFAAPVYRLIQETAPTFGRGGFLIHGDSRTKPGEASSGCIVLGYVDREAIERFSVATVLVAS